MIVYFLSCVSCLLVCVVGFSGYFWLVLVGVEFSVVVFIGCGFVCCFGYFGCLLCWI